MIIKTRPIRTETIYAEQDKDPRPPKRVGTLNTNDYTTRLYNPTQSSGQLEGTRRGLVDTRITKSCEVDEHIANQAEIDTNS